MTPLDTTEMEPYDQEVTRAQADTILGQLPEGGSVLDLGCGIGRVARLFGDRAEVIGVDRDEGTLAAFEEATGGETHLVDFAVNCDALPSGAFDGVLLLGNILMEIVDMRVARDLFEAISARLKPGGFLAIDDFPISLWEEITEGNWCTGLDEDESMQMIWEPGEPVFVLRRGSQVDPDCWVPRESDRRFRLWSLGALELMGSCVGLGGPVHHPEGRLMLMKRL
ncbi:MAG: class I SAM-dependent methyltransferase [Phycisphaerales bacterium]|nr:class I SAM-dependent methyltransferase [Phycisphaerales bacterium]